MNVTETIVPLWVDFARRCQMDLTPSRDLIGYIRCIVTVPAKTTHPSGQRSLNAMEFSQPNPSARNHLFSLV